MFSLKVTDVDVTKVFNVVSAYIMPNHISLHELADICFHSVGDIAQRKVRLCIVELRNRGYLIIGKRGYSMAGDDPAPVIEFVNKMYSRANNITKSTDIMFHGLKQKYGDSVSEKVHAMPGQPMLHNTEYKPLFSASCGSVETQPNLNKISEPPFRKSYNAKGEQIES